MGGPISAVLWSARTESLDDSSKNDLHAQMRRQHAEADSAPICMQEKQCIKSIPLLGL